MSTLIITLLLTLILAYNRSKRFRYYTKFVLFLLGNQLVTIPFVPLMLPWPRDHRNTYFPARGCILLGRLVGVRYEVRGLQNIKKTQGGVVLINHQSSLDIIVCSELSKCIGKFATVVKKSILYVFPFPWLWGTIYLDRQSKKAGRNFISRESEEIKKNNTKILIYPEGTRNDGNELLPFKKGAFFIALETNCDIYPVVVSKYHFLDHKNYEFGRGRCIIEFLPAISTKGMDKSHMDDLIKKCWNLMQTKYEELSKETLKDK